MDTRNGHTEGRSSDKTSTEPIRRERVVEARQRLVAGDYDRPEVIDMVVDRLLERITDNY
jgi:hypothetical protein